jgi:hypothetical protein
MERNREVPRARGRAGGRHEHIIREAIRGSLGWGLTAALFGALIGWHSGGVLLGLEASTAGAVTFGMLGWVLGTAVGIAEHWPLSRLLARSLGGTFVGALYGVYLLHRAANVSEDSKHLVALLWALAGALLGVSTSIKLIRTRPVVVRADAPDPDARPEPSGETHRVDVRIR